MNTKKTLVLGASQNPQRYSFLALNKLKKYGHPVVAIGKRKALVNEIEIATETVAFEDVHTITLYLNPHNQVPYYNYIIGLKPQRIIFNPGTENPELATMAQQHGIQTLQACTLVMLSANQY
jgi:uncharacterized protein